MKLVSKEGEPSELPMRIFVAHSSNFDFKNELYLPLRESELNKRHKIVLPQEKNEPEPVTRDIIRNVNLLVAEVSHPSTGQGIELGWADVFGIPIVCMYKKGSKISNSLHKITDKFISYDDPQDMVQQLATFIDKVKRS